MSLVNSTKSGDVLRAHLAPSLTLWRNQEDRRRPAHGSLKETASSATSVRSPIFYPARAWPWTGKTRKLPKLLLPLRTVASAGTGRNAVARTGKGAGEGIQNVKATPLAVQVLEQATQEIVTPFSREARPLQPGSWALLHLRLRAVHL